MLYQTLTVPAAEGVVPAMTRHACEAYRVASPPASRIKGTARRFCARSGWTLAISGASAIYAAQWTVKPPRVAAAVTPPL